MKNAQKDAYNDFGRLLSKGFTQLANVELEWGKAKDCIPQNEVIRSVKALAKHLGVHLYYSMAGEITEQKPHIHLVVLCKDSDTSRVLEKLQISKIEDFQKSCKKHSLYWFLEKRNISLAHHTDACGLQYKFAYLAKHESFAPLEVACPYRSQSCRKAIKKKGKCPHGLTYN